MIKNKILKSRKIMFLVFIVISTGVSIDRFIKSNMLGITIIHSYTYFNTGVLIEHNGTRIYIDPTALPTKYGDQSADIILITHPHFDHYSSKANQQISTNTTKIYAPAGCPDILTAHNATGLVPGDKISVNDVNITAFPAYDFEHPKKNGWCGYIVKIDNTTIFYSGDSNNLTEYKNLSGKIDVAIISVWSKYKFGQTLSTLGVIKPKHFIPAHFMKLNGEQMKEFISDVENTHPEIETHYTWFQRNPIRI